MEIIGAGALIAVAIVLAALLYGRMHGPRPTSAAPHGDGASRATLESSERAAQLARREEMITRGEAELEAEREALADKQRELEHALEQASGLSAARAKQMLLDELQDQARHDSARRIRQIEEETKREADRRVRNILSICMQRLAAGHAAETTVSVVHLAADDMKGRIIGREGRNIRALENLTGVDFIIDDTPGAVVLSGFDGVRRELARLTLEKLLQDGRIHPARVQEPYCQAKAELDDHILELGEHAVFEAGVQGVDLELVKLLGRLQFRTSYGQNVLAHSVEVSRMAGMMADELGASAKTARRAALLHDIGKAVSHEIEGPHALVAGDLARRHGESEAVAHAMEAHHNEVEPQTIEGGLGHAAGARSGPRAGAVGQTLEQYVEQERAVSHQYAGRSVFGAASPPQRRQLALPFLLVTLHHRLVVHIEKRVFFIPPEFESGDLGFVRKLGYLGIPTQHRDSFAGHGFHAPVARHCDDE